MSYIRNIFYMKKRICIYLFIVLTSLIFCNGVVIQMYSGYYNLSIFDLLISPIGIGVLSKNVVATQITIIYILFILNVLDFNKDYGMIVRARSRQVIWKSQVSAIILISFLYSAILVSFSYCVGGLMLGDFSNRWASKSGTVYKLADCQETFHKILPFLKTDRLLILIFISLFIGLSAIGMGIGFLRMKIEDKYVYLLLVVIIIFEVVSESCSIIIQKMTIYVYRLAQPKIIIFNIGIMMLVIIFSYFFGKGSIINKDFIYKKE